MSAEDTRPIVDRERLKAMSPDEVVAARKAGRLDLLQRGVDLSRGKALTLDQRVQVVENLSDAELEAADAAGRLAPLRGPAGPVSADLGARGPREPTMRERLKRMPPEQVVAMRRAGTLDALMRGEIL